jgi:hypothetical protein
MSLLVPTLLRRKASDVVIRSTVSAADLSHTKRYAPTFRTQLSQRYNSVNDKNRYAALDILLTKLSSNVGRRAYRMTADLHKSYFARFKEHGVDWHDLKLMSRPALFNFLRHELAMPAAEKVLLLAALEQKVCGVLVEGTSMDPHLLCMRRGKEEFGWRCGAKGHLADVYFEKKRGRSATAVSVQHRRDRVDSFDDHGVNVQVRPMLDFSIEGRLHHDAHPRVWSSPTDPVFNVFCMGFEFHVHHDDPRAGPQIADAADDWATHAAVIQNVLWEMVEMYGVEHAAQPMALQPGDVRQHDDHAAALQQMFTSVDKETGTVIEHRLRTSGESSTPWFRPAPPQPFRDGVPQHLPFAPTFAVQCTYRLPTAAELAEDGGERHLRSPMVELSCLSHPRACYALPRADEERALGHVLDYAKRIPYALPFTLYFRVDTAKVCRGQDGFVERRRAMYEDNSAVFDLRRFVSRHDGGAARGVVHEVELDGAEPSP